MINDKVIKRFLKYVRKSEKCWEWLAAKNSEGYGYFYFQNKMHKAHRISFLIFKGGISKHMVIDHLCRNTSCVNPEHLRAVTNRENMKTRITYNSTKLICKRGHKLTEENTYIAPNGSRRCRACNLMFALGEI